MADKRIKRIITAIFDRRSADQANDQLVRSMKDAGARGGDNFAREIRASFNRRIAELRESLAAGVIDQAEFRKQADQAASAFNAAMLESIKKARDEGKLTDSVYVKLTRELKRTGDQGEDAWSRIKAGITKAGLALAGFFALDRLRAFAAGSIEAARSAEESALRFQGVWRANAGAVGRSFEQLQRFIREVRDTTLFSGDELERAAAQLLTYKSIAGDTFERTIRLATDMSAVFGSLESATMAVAKALDDPINGLGLLQRQNFTFDESVKASVASLVEQGKTLEAQSLILSTLEAELGGVAQQMASGWAGAVDRYNKAWDDLKETFGNFLLDATNGPSVMDRLTGAIRWATDNLAALVRVVVGLATAAGAAGLWTVIVRLRLAILAANAGTVTFIGTLKTLQAFMGPKGWIALGIGVATERLLKWRDAAKEATRQTEEFVASLQAMGAAELDAEITRLAARARELRDRIQVAEETGDGRRKRALERELEQVRATGMEAVRVRSEMKQAVADVVTPDATANADALKDEISLLKQGADLRILSNEEFARAYQLSVEIRAELSRGNLSLERRIELTQRLNTLTGATGERSVPTGIAGGGPRGVGAGGMILTPFQIPPIDRGRVSEWDAALSELSNHASTAAFYMERSFTDFFSALATGFDDTRDGFHSLADAAVGVGASIVAGLAGGMRDYHMAQAVGKLAQGIWPVNPAALASAAKHVAAAGLFGALEQATGGAGRRSGVASPVSSPGPVGMRAAERAGPGGPEVNLYINPWDPRHPEMQRGVYQATQYAQERYGGARVTVKPYPRAG